MLTDVARYDVAVLGAGAAGCVVARRLADHGVRVCLVEAGPDYGQFGDPRWPREMLDAQTLPMTHLWEQDRDDRSSSRARIIGGCCSHNAHNRLFEPYALILPPDLHLVPWTNASSEVGYQISIAGFFLKPRSRGAVTLISADPRDPPRVDHGFLSDPHDLDAVVAALDLARRLVREEPLERYAGDEVRPGTDDLEAYVRANVRGYFHPVGTCALGRVCDANGRVRGHERLVVADASFIPTILARTRI